MTNRFCNISGTAIVDRETPVPEQFVRHLRRADDFINLAVSAAARALELSGETDVEPVKQGVFVGTAFGPLETNFSSLGSLVDEGEGQMSPTLFSHSVLNCAAGYISRLFNCHGPALTITSYGWPFLVALQEARQALINGGISRAFVIGAEIYSALLADAYERLFDSPPTWSPCAVAWVLDIQGNGPFLKDIRITERGALPDNYLYRADETWQGNGLSLKAGHSHPLTHAEVMTRALKKATRHDPVELVWSFNASFGEAEIVMAIS